MAHALKNKNVLLTGATGLVGGHVAEALLGAGAKLFTTYRNLNEKSYFVKTGLSQKATNIFCDILDLEKLSKIVKDNKIEYVFHLAAQLKLVSLYETFAFNIMGTNNILEACRNAGTVKGIILASSNRAYYVESGLNKAQMKMMGENPYDISKTAADLIAKNYIKAYKSPVVICRFGNVYGPGDLQKRIIPVILKSAVTGEALQVQVKPSKRNYIFARDLSAGLLQVSDNFKKLAGQDINFETKDNLTVEELLKKTGKILGTKINYTKTVSAAKEIALKKPQKNLAGTMLGWKPKYTLQQGLLETFEWYKNL